MNKKTFNLVVIAAVVAALTLPLNLSAGEAVKIRVTADRVNIREAALITSKAVGKAEKGQILTVVEKAGEWYIVRLPDGAQGYIHSFTVEEVSEAEAAAAEKAAAKPAAAAVAPGSLKIQVTADRANVRKSGALSAPVLRQAEKGETFPVVEKSGEWYLIQLSDGTAGFIHSFTVAELKEGEAVPAAKPAEKPAEKPKVEAKKAEEAAVAPPPVEKPAVAPRPAAAAPEVIAAPRDKAKSFSMFLARAGYFVAADSAYTDVYKNGLIYGGEVRLGGEKIAGWLEFSYRAETGALTFTKEETKVSVMAVEAGALYRFKLEGSKIHPYAGAGIGYFMFKETNQAIGEAKKNGIGFCALGGATYFLGESFAVDARIKFDFCKMTPADFNIQIGGFTIGIGFGYRW